MRICNETTRIIDETMEKALGNIEEEKKKVKEITSELKEKTNTDIMYLNNFRWIYNSSNNKDKTEIGSSYLVQDNKVFLK